MSVREITPGQALVPRGFLESQLLYFEIPHPQRIGLHKRKAVRREKDSLLKTKPHIEYLLVRFLNFDILMPGNPTSLPSQLVVDMLWNWYLGALW